MIKKTEFDEECKGCNWWFRNCQSFKNKKNCWERWDNENKKTIKG